MEEKIVTSHKVHFDILRILSICLVIFNHTYIKGFYLFSVRQDSLFYPLYLMASIADKIAVPLFFMISGALLLGKSEESVQTLFKKRILRFFLVLLLFSFLQNLYYLRLDLRKFSPGNFLTSVYTSNFPDAYWYLYAYLAFLFMLPFLRKMVLHLEDKEYHYLILLRFIFGGLLPIFQWCIKGDQFYLNGSFSLVLVMSDIIFYPLLGYYLENRLHKETLTGKHFRILAILSAASIALCALMTHIRCTTQNDWTETTSQTFFSILTFIPATAVYLAIRQLTEKMKLSVQKQRILSLLGGCSFGIMLIENILRERTEFITDFLGSYIGQFPATILWVLTVYLLGTGIVLILKQLPVFRKLL